MSRAIDQNGIIIILSKYSRNELKKLKRKNIKYYCLICKKRMILKVGERKRPHFSHLKLKQKVNNGKETEHHKLGTDLLYRSFVNQGFYTKKEHYIPSIKQRPDVVVAINNESYAFEFQLSKISLSLFKKRTFNLKDAGFKPIWLLSSKLLVMKNNNRVKLTPFLSQFIHQFSKIHPPQLFFYHPEQKKVIILEHILFYSEKYAYVQKRIIKVSELSIDLLKNARELNVKSLLYFWQREKFKFRTKPRNYARGTEYQWRLWLYKKNIHFENLPAHIYLPTRNNYVFKVPPWNWQSRIYLTIIQPLKVDDVFYYEDCINVIKKYLIPKSHYPLIKYYPSALINYLNLLTYLNIIKPISHHKYIKINQSNFNQALKNLLIADDDIINQLLYNLN
ncbi:MAG TPA: competence protein CoiA family protein [Pseudogracilibacillus sp.]|nr:competence protein CoiA family protein [Pseudogracilibacillus sp.]